MGKSRGGQINLRVGAKIERGFCKLEDKSLDSLETYRWEKPWGGQVCEFEKKVLRSFLGRRGLLSVTSQKPGPGLQCKFGVLIKNQPW